MALVGENYQTLYGVVDILYENIQVYLAGCFKSKKEPCCRPGLLAFSEKWELCVGGNVITISRHQPVSTAHHHFPC